MKAVIRLFGILEVLGEHPDGLQVHGLADLAGLPASTTHRFLTELRTQGYVEQDPDSRLYFIGPRMFQLASRLMDNLDIRRVSAPFLKGLSKETGLNSFLTIYDRDRTEAICVDTFEGSGQYRFYVGLGKSMPLHCTASGKAIAAYLPAEEQDVLFESRKLERFTPHTELDYGSLRAEWQEIQARGFAICDEEFEPGVTALAAPIKDSSNRVVGSLCVVGIQQALRTPVRDHIGEKVAEAGDRISEILGAQR